MKNQGYSTAINWHYITVSLIFAVTILLLVLYMPGIREFDSGLLQSVRQFLSPFPPVIPALMNEIARNYYVWPLIASGGILISHKYYIEAFLLVFFTEGSYLVTSLIKSAVCRQRPCGVTYPGYSFPSGHSLTAMCFFGILVYLSIKHTYGFWRYLLVTVLGVLILLAGLSRLWLGVHFPTDVLEGMLLGFILVNLCIILDKFFSRR